MAVLLQTHVCPTHLSATSVDPLFSPFVPTPAGPSAIHKSLSLLVTPCPLQLKTARRAVR